MTSSGLFSATMPALSGLPAENHQDTWRPLQLLNIYRLTLTALFLAVILFGKGSYVLGEYNTRLFFLVSFAYALIAIANIFTIQWQIPSFNTQVYYQIIADIVAITLLMHASGSIRSGLGFLLVVAIAGGSLLIAHKTALLFAAVATIAILLEQAYLAVSNTGLETSYPQAGLLGATFFATSWVAQFLIARIRESEALAAQRGVDLANMEQLTQYIIQRMQTGIIVVDPDNRVRLINDSAQRLLGVSEKNTSPALEELSPALVERLKAWQKDERHANAVLQPTTTAPPIIPRFAQLGTHRSGGSLIFLEDTTTMAQQAQKLKLASLGQLTASIAHEVRNPLAAISHASQLLAEAQGDNSERHRLIAIILRHAQRVNTIIENVLQLSRREASQPQPIALAPWLKAFVAEFCQTKQIPPSACRLHHDDGDIRAQFDPSQLHQIVWNLAENGLRYSNADADGNRLVFRTGMMPDAHTPFLQVIDNGPGVPEALREKLFEPFFTTEQSGTGLGLYIAKELCECNQAQLHYLPDHPDGNCFAILFADNRRSM